MEAGCAAGGHGLGGADPALDGNRALLQELIALGMDLARALQGMALAQAAAHTAALQAHAQSRVQAAATGQAAPPAPPVPDIAATTAAFEQTARGLRRAMRLAQHLATPSKPHGAAQAQARPSASTSTLTLTPEQARAQARRTLRRLVEDHIGRTHSIEGGLDVAALEREALDRLDAPEMESDLHRPVREVVDEITRDLGLSNTARIQRYKRRTPLAVRALHAWAEQPSASPLASSPQAAEGDEPSGPDPTIPDPIGPTLHPSPPSPGLSDTELIAHLLGKRSG